MRGLSRDISFRECLVLTFSVSALSSGYFVSKCETRVDNPRRSDMKRAETGPYGVGSVCFFPCRLGDVFVASVLDRVCVGFNIQPGHLQRVIISDNFAE